MTKWTVALTVGERLSLPEIFPKEGKFTLIEQIKKIAEKIKITEEIAKETSLTIDKESMRWEKPELEFPVDLEASEFSLIKNELIKMDNESKITEKLYTLYIKFVINK